MRTKAAFTLVIFILFLTLALPFCAAVARRHAGEATSIAELEPPPDQVEATLAQIPLYFVENKGQLDARVAYYVQGKDKTLYFTPEGVTFALRGDRGVQVEDSPFSTKREAAEPALERWVVKLEFVGANPGVQPVGEDETGAVVSYFKGRPQEWKTGLRTCSRVAYSDLWPGIDLEYSGTVNRLKYQFVVQPGADPSQIRLAYRGAAIHCNELGQLEVSTPLGGFHDAAPCAYQEIDGERVKVAVAYDFQLAPRGAHGYTFDVGEYDRAKPLVLDPVILVYCGYIGGSSSDQGARIAVDSLGSVYVTGHTESTEATFPVAVGPDLSFNGVTTYDTDVFVAKVSADGAGLDYCGYIGGSAYDVGVAIALDDDGNAYVGGYTGSSESDGFPVTVGPDVTYNGGGDAFVAKVNVTGTELIYCGYVGGSDCENGNDVAVDGWGSAYLTGCTLSDQGEGFPVRLGPHLTYSGGEEIGDAFVAKVITDGSGLDYCGYIGGSSDDSGNGIAVDGLGSAYVTGWTISSESDGFPVAVGPDVTFGGDSDAFVSKVMSDGSALEYCGYIGGSGWEAGRGIAVDASGAAYIVGGTSSSEASFPVAVGPETSYGGGTEDAFVAKVAPDGASFTYSGYIGGSTYDAGIAIALDDHGNAYVAGCTDTEEATFPVTGGPDLTYNGGLDAFVAKVLTDGSGLAHCGYLGGSGSDMGRGIAVDGAGAIYVAGATGSSEASFPVMVGPGLSYGGLNDVFVAKIQRAAQAIVSHQPQAHEIGVARTADISATFCAELNASTVSSDTFAVHGHLGGLATGTLAYDGDARTVTLDPNRTFHGGEVIRVCATGGISAADGSALTPYGWQFTAGDVYPRGCVGFADSGASLAGVSNSSVAWGDYDDDGDLDVVVTGYSGTSAYVSKLYRNDGGTAPPAFTDVGAALAGVIRSSVAWGDYDNDGDLDLLLMGQDSGGLPLSAVYRNDGGAAPLVFTDIDAGLADLYWGSAAWGDYDNDADLDILLTGRDVNSTPVSKVYRNEGEDTFVAIDAGLTGVYKGAAAWGDSDNDGDLDILLTGRAVGFPVSKVYRNDGSDSFVDVGTGLAAVDDSSVAWGDYDNDGDLDIVLSGYGAGVMSEVYRNDGGGAFTDINAGLVGVVAGSLAWGDYDNDGDLDILLTGYTGSTPLTKLYRNDGPSGFTDIGAGLHDVYLSSVAWGDYDNDGDLDIVLTGFDRSTYVSRVYRNDELPQLGITKWVTPTGVLPEERISYTIAVSNTGIVDATGAVISDTLPAEFTFAGPVTLDPPGAGTAGSPPILVSGATIVAGSSITITFPVTANSGSAAGLVITNTAAVTSSEVSTPIHASVPITIDNASPTLGTVAPSSGGGPAGVTTTFTTTWQDANGWQDLKQCYFHIGDGPSVVGNVTLLYNAVKNRLWLRSDDGTAWTGGCSPGDADVLENSQAIVHCNSTTVQGSGDTLGVTWAIEFKSGYTGEKKLGLKCKDVQKARAKAKWKGTWTIY